MAHEVEGMVYAVDATGNGVPWHGLGVRREGAVTVAQALSDVPELGATVEAWTIEAVSPDGKKRIVIGDDQPSGGYVANVRHAVIGADGVKPEVVLGVVTDAYELAQSREQFTALETIIGERDLEVETAISLFGGKVHTMLLRKPEAVKMVGDLVVPYLLVVNSFDASRALTFASTPVRVVCANTLKLAMDSRATRSFSLRHTSGLQEKLDEARKAMGLADAYIEALRKRAIEYSKRKLSTGDLKKLLEATFPMPVRRANEDAPVFARRQVRTREAQLTVRELLRTADNLAEHRNTAWGYLNAVIEWEDHDLNGIRPGKTDEITRTRQERRMQKVALSDSEYVARAQDAIAGVLVAA